MQYQERLTSVLLADPARMQALKAVRILGLNDGWIGAGFVREAVWDNFHGLAPRPVTGDVDVVFFDNLHCSSDDDRRLEEKLRRLSPNVDWSVKNQARMHHHNGNAPYCSTEDALRFWPETATAVAVRLEASGSIGVIAPYGLSDLFELRLRPTPPFEQENIAIFRDRVESKRWMTRYPRLQLILPA
ncbi:nucleotidyltransferase family protein [Kluyvera ascorbata]|uniref:nucleotidyltransferase family protein n=1 Tax=Kluyvera ascorbata TaxID=51288 RepID=UPI0034D5BF65